MVESIIKGLGYHLPLWMLFVRLASIAYGLRSKLDEPIIQLSMSPIELWIGSVTQSKGSKSHLMETSWPQTGTAK